MGVANRYAGNAMSLPACLFSLDSKILVCFGGILSLFSAFYPLFLTKHAPNALLQASARELLHTDQSARCRKLRREGEDVAAAVSRFPLLYGMSRRGRLHVKTRRGLTLVNVLDGATSSLHMWVDLRRIN